MPRALCDREFVDSWCSGFAELAEATRDCTPEWAAGITWVPADQIRETARLYATAKPACMTVGVAVEQSTNSFNTLRAAYILVALTGNVDVPGGNHFWENPLPGARIKALIGREMVDPAPGGPHGGRLPPGRRELPRVEHLEEHRHAASPTLSGRSGARMQPHPYPRGSRTPGAPRPGAVDFLVAMDMFMTPTAELADYVLPAATYLEKDDSISGRRPTGAMLSFSRKVVEPRGEARDDREVFIDLCRRMGLDYGFGSVRELLDWLLEPRT